MITVFKKKYDGESLYDLDRDISEAMMEEYNPEMTKVPQDEHGLHRGTFVVTVEWVDEEPTEDEE